MTRLFVDALRYPLRGRAGVDGLAVDAGLVVVALLLARLAGGLWPSPLAVAPAAALLVPAVLLAGHLGDALRRSADGDATPPGVDWSLAAPRRGLVVLAVAAAYLLVPAVVLLGVGALVGAGSLATVGPVAGVAATLALLALAAFAYAMPAGVARALRAGVRAGVRARSLDAPVSGAYFVAWTGAVVAVVPAWLLVRAAPLGSLASVLAAVALAYAHLVAARLVGEGIARATR